MAEAPAAPAVKSLDPVEWTNQINGLNKRVNDLESDKQDLEKSVCDLRAELTRQANAAASARGAIKPLKEEVEKLRAKLRESQDLQELVRLRAEVAKMHTEKAKGDRARTEEDQKTKAQLEELNLRAIRAEGKFQALESTASMMATSRDKANEAAAMMLAERDQARKRVEEIQFEMDQNLVDFKKQQDELEKARAELKALRSAKGK